MIDSTNPRILADQIRALWAKVKSITGLPATTSATAGQILKLDSDKKATWADEYSYTPPAYSETETATGQTWIDGKPLYRKIVVIPADETATGATESKTFSIEDMNIKFVSGYTIRGGETPFYMPINNYNSSTTYSSLTWYAGTATHKLATTTGYYGGAYIEVIYTKPDPVPAQVDKGTGMITGEEPEPETKKTRKKSS